MSADTRLYTEDQVRSAIKADRKRRGEPRGEPVAWWVYDHPLKRSHLAEKQPENLPEHCVALPLILEKQSESYADRKVKAALEAAAHICWLLQTSEEFEPEPKDKWLEIAKNRIRELIPKG